jgi:hypothetical protein
MRARESDSTVMLASALLLLFSFVGLIVGLVIGHYWK